MKILNKAKKGLTGIGLFLITLHSKVFAKPAGSSATPGVLTEMRPAYGVEYPDQNSSTGLWNVYRFLAVFLVLLIGLIVYFKKSKSSTKKKVLVTILAIVIAVVLYFLIS